ERTEDKKKVFQMAAARLQATEASADKKPDQQESDITSQKASIHTPSPRPNGSVTNFESPVQHSNSIHTITESASRADLKGGHVSGSVRSPAMVILPKRQVEHLPNRGRVPKKVEGFLGHVPEGEKEGAGEEEWSSSRCGKKVEVLCRPLIPRPLCGSTAHHQQHGPGRGDGRGPTCSTPRIGYVGDRRHKW
ncbi:hypothetical protein ILYODFUR_033240, partial [Ilyodon furcidens]